MTNTTSGPPVVCLVARPLTGGELSGFLGKQSMKRTTTGILLIFLFSETVFDFFSWVNLSEILVDEISCLWLIVGTLSKIKKCKAKSCSIGPLL